MEKELDFTKCPFCGLALSTETELARKDESLWAAVKALQALLKPIESCMEANKPSHKGKTPDGRPFRQLSVTVTLSHNQIKQTQALLTDPEVVKVMEKKP